MPRFLTKRGIDKILRKIMETGGLTEDMEKDIQRLRDEFDEREGVLKRYGETYEGEDQDEYDWEESRRVRDDNDDDVEVFTSREEEKLSNDWRSRYEEMRKKYIDRFFGGDDVREDFNRTMEMTEDDVIRDGEPQTFDELLERTEG